MKNIIVFFVGFVFINTINGQIFNDRSIVNLPSVELLDKHKLDVRIGHRFGNIAGVSGGWETLYGLESASDIKIGAQYGLGDHFNIGVNRSKGIGPLKQIVNLELKLGLLKQFTEEKEKPLSIAIMVEHSTSTMPKSENPESLTAFTSFSHRMMTSGQLILAREFNPWFSAQLNSGFVHRNNVIVGDRNDIFFLGGAISTRLSKVVGVLLEGIYPFPASANGVVDRQPQYGLGVEIYTGGHVFTIKLTNTKSLSINDGISYTSSRWQDGEFRLGFTISRIFNL